MLSVAVIISGSGSNLQAIIDQQAHYGYRVACVLSNVADAYGLKRAQAHDITTHLVDHRQFTTREDFERAMIEQIDSDDIDLVVLAGFMRVLTPLFIQHYHGKLLNIHPSLLPKFKGLRTHARAIETNECEHGASVHLVTAELDGGPVIAQARLTIQPNESPESLSQRVLALEHQLYPAVIACFAQGLIELFPTLTIDKTLAPIDLHPLLTKVN